MEKVKISFIATVLNEENNIFGFLDSIRTQTIQADEVIIIDGGSIDNTLGIIKKYRKDYKYPIIVEKKKGNRAISRNFAIKLARNDTILCSDAGCILDKHWVEEIIKPFRSPKTDIVAGYYRGIDDSIFQKCIIPYVLVMSDRVNPNNFLPATRSMAFKKSVWRKLGGFPEEYSHNEDYVFANKIKKEKFKIVFTSKAIVNWIPPKTIKQSYRMFWRFAYGDTESGIIRPKVVLIFLRYIIFYLVLFYFILNPSITESYFLLFFFFVYIGWSVNKNYRYVRNIQAFFLLPFLQVLSDIAVMSGSILGIINRRWGTQKTS